MLVLRRRVGEAIVIGNDIEIEVTEISHTRVKLGVKAPRAVSVARRETLPVVHENRQAAEILCRTGGPSVDTILHRLLKSPKDEPISNPANTSRIAAQPRERGARQDDGFVCR
jgi:carbon storage regulator